MKHKIFLAGLCLLALICVLSAFGPNDAPKAPAGAGPDYHLDSMAAVGGNQHFNFRKDTITDAEADTIPIGPRSSTVWNLVSRPTNFLSLYTYDISVVRASLSGTHNVKLYLDKSSTYNPSPTSGSGITDWFTIDSTSVTTATTAMMRSTDATGFRYRLRIKGTGTQSSTYTIWTAWKQKN